MANRKNPLWMKHLLDVWMNLVAANSAGSLRIALLTNTYTYSATDEFYSSLSGVLGTGTLASITTTGGVLDADDKLVTGLSAGQPHAVYIHWWTGVAGTSRLIAYIDQGVGFDVTPSGDVLVKWSDDANAKIFPLGGILP